MWVRIQLVSQNMFLNPTYKTTETVFEGGAAYLRHPEAPLTDLKWLPIIFWISCFRKGCMRFRQILYEISMNKILKLSSSTTEVWFTCRMSLSLTHSSCSGNSKLLCFTSLSDTRCHIIN